MVGVGGHARERAHRDAVPAAERTGSAPSAAEAVHVSEPTRARCSNQSARGMPDRDVFRRDRRGPAGSRGRRRTGGRRELLESIWCLEHPRVPDVLDALATSHPDRVTSNAARKTLAKHLSILAERRGR